MDNITHTLLGLAIAEVSTKPKESPQSRKALYLASGISSNLPDIDVFITKFISHGKLGYLLHHRGHTHTFISTPILGTLLLLCFYFFWKKESLPWKKIIFLTYFGYLFHIFSDFWNIYGVHPLWPFNNHWFYGDMVFIIEPLIWIFTIPFLFSSANKLPSKIILSIPLIGIFLLAMIHPAIPHETPIFMLIVLAALGSFYLYSKSSFLKKVGWVSSFVILLTSLFFISQVVKARFTQQMAATPFPANPICWQVFQAQKNGDLYQIDVWQISLLPKLFPVSHCGNFTKESTSAIAHINTLPQSEEIWHMGTYRGSITEYKNILQSCQGREYMKFARIPFWANSGSQKILGDIRFDRDSSVGFAEIILNDEHQEPCPKLSAPWESVSILNTSD